MPVGSDDWLSMKAIFTFRTFAFCKRMRIFHKIPRSTHLL